jgi:hypothetical protein
VASTLPPRVPAQVAGSHRPAAIMLMVEPLPDGRYRLSTPHARGWAAMASTPIELARGVHGAVTEATVAAYARQRGKVYDLDGLTPQVHGDPLAGRPPTRESRPRRSRRAHSPADWQMVSNGSWKSPNGRVYRPGAQVVKKVIAAREALGLPVD